MLQVILLILAVVIGLAVVMTMDVEPRKVVGTPAENDEAAPAAHKTQDATPGERLAA